MNPAPASSGAPGVTGARQLGRAARPGPRAPAARMAAPRVPAPAAAAHPARAPAPPSLLSHAGPAAPPASPAAELGWQPELPSRYVLGRTLGGGSYGVVYLAVDRSTGAEVAVKAMAKQRPGSTRARTLKKLHREAALQARVQHAAGVVKLLGAYEDGECAYLVLERLQGGDLEAALAARGPLPEPFVAAAARECVKVIATCHSAGVMHGDVKPANFMLREPLPASRAGLAALAAARGPRWLTAVDFGCAQALGRASLNRRTGTPVYMAPEVFQRDYGGEADLWSLGVTLYQLLSGRFPFWASLDECRQRSVDEVMRSVLSDPIPLAGGAWASVSPSCVAFLSGLLTRDPGARMTAAEALEHPWFREQLGGATAGAGATAATAPATTPCASLAALPDDESNIVPMAGDHGPPACAWYSRGGGGGVGAALA